jgi:iron complex transport system permease protein
MSDTLTSRDVAPSDQGVRRRGVQRWQLALALLLVAAGAFASLFIGVTDLTPLDLLDPDEAQARVFLASRVPRLLAILLSGSAMAVAGLVMMTLTRNRFVSPHTAGTTEWAGLGIVVATLWFGSSSLLGKMGIAVLFALVGTWVFLRLLQRMVFTDMIVVPLVGIMLGGVVIAVAMFLAYRFDLLQTMDAWTNGDFSGVVSGRYELLWAVAAATVVAYVFADRFAVAGMGESFAVTTETMTSPVRTTRS